jgi:hypothetical protein
MRDAAGRGDRTIIRNLKHATDVTNKNRNTMSQWIVETEWLAEVFREDREGGLWSLTGGVAESRNFGEAWGVCAGRPGSSPEPPEDARVVSEEPGLPRVREGRDEVTSKVVRKPREVTVFWWPAPPPPTPPRRHDPVAAGLGGRGCAGRVPPPWRKCA